MALELTEFLKATVFQCKHHRNHVVSLLFYHDIEVLYFWLCIKDEAVTVLTMVLSNVYLHPNSSSCYSELKLFF